MSTDTLYFVAATFPTWDGADFALGRIMTAQIRRGNAALVVCDDRGHVKIKETRDWGMGKSALLGGLAAIVIPGIGLVGGLVGGALLSKLVDAGFPDAALRKLGAELTPGSSALVILIDETQHDLAESELRRAGGKVIAAGLKAEFAQQIEQSLATSAQQGDAPAP